MDQTNRVVIVGVALLWIFLIFLVILLAWGAPDESINRLGDLAGYLEDHNEASTKLIITFGGIILALLFAIIVIYEIAPPDSGNVRVDKVGGGDVRISTDEVIQRLEEELRAMPGLLGVQATVMPRGKKAEVNLDLYVSTSADLTATSDEACRRARDLVEGRMGIALDMPPRAQIHYRELQVAQAAQGASQSAAPGIASSSSYAPSSTSSWTPAATPPSNPAPTTHEASETDREDRPTGA
jgi:hypothetical protein